MQSQQALLLAGKSMIEQAKPADDPARLARPGSYYPKRGAAGNWRAGAGQGRARGLWRGSRYWQRECPASPLVLRSQRVGPLTTADRLFFPVYLSVCPASRGPPPGYPAKPGELEPGARPRRRFCKSFQSTHQSALLCTRSSSHLGVV